MELLFVLPVLLLTFLAAFQFGVTMLIEQAVTHAATVGAREAGKGGDIDDVVCVVETIMSVHDIRIGPCASVVLEDPTAATPVEQRGAFSCTPPASPALSENEVRVTVCVDLTKKPFLNALRPFGIAACGSRFVVSSVVKKECAGTPSDTGLSCGCSS